MVKHSAIKFNILMICLGNICRSPLAEEIMRAKINKAQLDHLISVDSAGTSGLHKGSEPDPRSCEIALLNGLKLNHSSRPLLAEDYENFDLMLVMDESNLKEVRSRSIKQINHSKIHLITSLDNRPGALNHVPDPYWSGIEEFNNVFYQLDYCCDQWLNKISTNIKV